MPASFGVAQVVAQGGASPPASTLPLPMAAPSGSAPGLFRSGAGAFLPASTLPRPVAAAFGVAPGLLRSGARSPVPAPARRLAASAHVCRLSQNPPHPQSTGERTPRPGDSTARLLAGAPSWLATNRWAGQPRPRPTCSVSSRITASSADNPAPGNATSEGPLSRAEKLQKAWSLVAAEVVSFLLILVPSPIPLPALPTSPLLHALGVLPIALGVALLVAATWQLRSSLSALPVPLKNAVLQTQGAYGIVRNPMWSSLLFIGTGVTVATGSLHRVVLLAVLTWVVDAKAKMEESFLAERFGDEYASYSKRVKRIIPFLY